ncbi:MAG: TlpA family protein disulfide reductase [Melioribacteraceae bacterium]|nr:TlpA family protein disulfide reductase [Melioribacteraceae bacterium]
MKSRFFVSLLLILLFLLTSCGSEEFTGKFGYEPESPEPGKTLTVKYNPQGTGLENSKSIELVVYSYNKDLISSEGYLMKKVGNHWEASLTPHAEAEGLLIKFVDGDDLELEDLNDKQGYRISLYDKSGIVFPGASAGYAAALGSWIRSVGLDGDSETSIAKLREAFQTYPEVKTDYLEFYFRQILRAEKETANETIAAELDAVAAKENLTEDELTLLASWYARIDNTDKADEYSKLVYKKYPSGKYVQTQKENEYYSEKDFGRKAELIEEILSAYPEIENPNRFYNDLAYQYVRNGKLVEAYDFIKANLDKMEFGYLNYCAGRIADDEAIKEKGLELMKTALDLAKTEVGNPKGEKPEYSTNREWAENRKHTYGSALISYGAALVKSGDNENALDYLEEGIETNKNYYVDVADIETYISSLIELERFEKAQEKVEYYVSEGFGTSQLFDYMRDLYIRKNGSETGFQEYAAKFESAAKQLMIEELKKEMINYPAPDFTLTNLEGKEVTLSSLKGKNVIIDFWATWCGPCLNSFPGMQKAVDRFKDNPDVEFLFVNTWENVEDKKKNAEDFIKQNNYTFNVLMDFDNKVIESFKVSGIPTKFIIDANGNVRFKSVGFSGNTDKIPDEIAAMIELIQS